MAKNALEKKVLDLLHANSFREVKKENIMDLFSNLNKLDPKVAIEFVKQFGGNISGSFKTMTDSAKNLFDSNDKSEQRCFDLYDKEMVVLLEKLKESKTEEERRFWSERIDNLKNAAEKKDDDNKGFKLEVLEKVLRNTLYTILLVGTGFVGYKLFDDPAFLARYVKKE